MGEVSKATDTRLDRIVAVKVLPAPTAHDPDSRARFEREAKTISQLKHPHTCTLYDVGTDAAAPAYLVMEYLDGETLAARIDRGAAPLRRCLRVAASARPSAGSGGHPLGTRPPYPPRPSFSTTR
jgi:serine/threonine protein kinase